MKRLFAALSLALFCVAPAFAQVSGYQPASASAPTTVTVNTPPNDLLQGPQSLTGAADVIVNSQGSGAAALQITGTFTGLAGVIRGSVDGTNYVNIGAYNANTGAILPAGTTISAVGVYVIPAAGYRDVEYHVTAVSTGTAVVNLNSSAGALDPPNSVASGGKSVNATNFPSTVDTNTGNATSSTPRMVLASNQPAIPTNPQATATTGVSVFSKIVANNTTSVAVDASAGTAYSVRVFNNSATIAYLKLYNASQGSTTCGSGTPVARIMIPASTSGAGAVFTLGGGFGVAFGTAITACVTTGIADNDSTAPAATTYIYEVDFK